MRLKPHSHVLVTVFVDGRYEIQAPTKVPTFRDAVKIALIKMYVPKMLEASGGKIEPDRYEAKLTEFKLRNQTFGIELIPIK